MDERPTAPFGGDPQATAPVEQGHFVRRAGGARVGDSSTRPEAGEISFRQLAESMPQIVWTARPDGYVDYLNQRWQDFTGLTDFEGDSKWTLALHPEDAPRALATYRQSVETGEPYEMKYRLRDRTGQFVWHLARGLPVRDATGRIIRWVGTCTDVHELKAAEESRARLAAIVESSADAIVGVTLEGVINSWNPAAERIYGYSSEEVLGKPISILVPAGHPDQELVTLDRIRQGERVEHYETIRIRKDGAIIDVSLTLSPVRDNSGRIIGASKIAREITERKRSERLLAEAQENVRRYTSDLERRVVERTGKLEESLRAMDTFCYTIAHDLRAPLRALAGFSKELGEDYGKILDQEGKACLERIVSAASRMDQLIVDLLRLGRLSTADLTAETVLLDDVLRRALLLIESDLHARHAQVEVEHPLGIVQANSVLLEQIVLNLLANAAKFARPGVPPRIRVRTEIRGDKVRLSVQDNGIGIKPQHAKKLFQPFLRLVSSEQYPGTGIGLAIVRKATERMGGSVGLESEPGQGSCFWVELPIGAEQYKAEALRAA